MRRSIVAFAFVLAACGQSQPPSSETASTPAVTGAPAAAPAEESEEAAEMQNLVAALAAPYNEASYEAGRRVFAQCRSCHTIEENGPNRVGPNLHGLIGRQAGSKADFNYSPAMRAAGFAWDAAHLDTYLTNPSAAVPNNRMAFAGVRNETQRRDLIAYLMVASTED